MPDKDKAAVLVATGDSVTSAHFQHGFGAMCQNTASDFRNLTGNHALFSYAGRYFNMNPNLIEYYNFARTGFMTGPQPGVNMGDILTAGPNTVDACNNAWARAFPPIQLADGAIRNAKAKGHKAYYVNTGGVNNTNWTTVLERLIYCRALEFATNIVPLSSIAWGAVGGRAGIVTNGGGCIFRVTNPNPLAMDYFHRVGVPGYDGPAKAAGTTADARQIINTVLNAGADKIVWMLYYDINPANVDLANVAWWYLRGNAPQWLVGLLPPRINPNLQPLVDPMWVGAVRGLINALNAAILAGIPANNKVLAQPAPIFLGADIQSTAVGGSPHPSANGHTKLANSLNAAYNALP